MIRASANRHRALEKLNKLNHSTKVLDSSIKDAPISTQPSILSDREETTDETLPTIDFPLRNSEFDIKDTWTLLEII